MWISSYNTLSLSVCWNLVNSFPTQYHKNHNIKDRWREFIKKWSLSSAAALHQSFPSAAWRPSLQTLILCVQSFLRMKVHHISCLPSSEASRDTSKPRGRAGDGRREGAQEGRTLIFFISWCEDRPSQIPFTREIVVQKGWACLYTRVNKLGCRCAAFELCKVG